MQEEIDLWGRVRRMNESARANLMASQEGRQHVMISLVSGAARAYFELLELDDQLAIARRTRDSYERTFKLFDDQRSAGLASTLELARCWNGGPTRGWRNNRSAPPTRSLAWRSVISSHASV